MPVTGDIENLIQNLNDTLADAAKHDRGIDAAGRRVRKKLSEIAKTCTCLLYTSPSPRDRQKSRMPSSA